MRLCLSCRRVSPAKSIYCGHCGRTFGGRLCASDHFNVPGVRCCTTCGGSLVTEEARFLPLGWLGPLLSGLVLLWLLRWGIGHAGQVGSAALHTGLSAFALLFGTTPCGVIGAINKALAWLITLWGLGWLLSLVPGQGGLLGQWLRGLPKGIFRGAVGLAKLLRGPWLIGLVLRLFFPARVSEREKKK